MFTWLRKTGSHPVCATVLRECLTPLTDADVEVLVLGFTHYPLLMEAIGWVVADIHLVNPVHETAVAVRRLLDADGLLSNTGGRSTGRLPA